MPAASGADPDITQTAVALLARVCAAEVPHAGVLGDRDPADVLVAVEAIAGGALAGAWPGDQGAGVLAKTGFHAARMDGGAL